MSSSLLPLNNIKPSYKSGYARNADQSVVPGLWKGLIGAWVPALGHAGLSNLFDVSGNQNHAVFTGVDADDWAVTDKGYAIGYDLANDEFATITDHPVLNVSGSISISIWVKWNSAVDNGGRGVFSKYNSATGNRGWLLQSVSGGQYTFFYQSVAGAFDAAESVTTVGTYKDSQWHKITCVLESSTSASIYIDGNLDVTKTSSVPASVATNAADVEIAAFNAGDSTFGGQISDALIYNRALSPNETSELYRLDPGGIFQKKSIQVPFFIEDEAVATDAPWYQYYYNSMGGY